MKKRNIVFGAIGPRAREASCFLYEVSTDRSRQVRSIMLNSVVPRSCIAVSPSEKYLAGFSDDRLCVWDIADLDNITQKKSSGKLRANSKLYFLSDEKHIIYGNTGGHIALFVIKGTELEELENYQYVLPVDRYGHSGWYSVEFKQCNGAEYVIGRKGASQRSIGLKVEKDVKGEVRLKQIFDFQSSLGALDIIGEDQVFVSAECEDYENFSEWFGGPTIHKYCVADYSGNIVQQSNHVIKTMYSQSDLPKCCLYNRETWEKRGQATILHVVCNEKDNHISFKEYACPGPIFSCPHVALNTQKTLLTAYLDKQNQIRCYDFQGNVLKHIAFKSKAFGGQCANFHPNGRMLLTRCEDVTMTKHILYPKGADERFKQLAYSPLTMPQYIALEKLCGEVEKERKKLFAQKQSI